MVRPKTLHVRTSVWTRTTAIHSHRSVIASVALVPMLLLFCGVGLSQQCPGPCPNGTECHAGTCQYVPPYKRAPDRCDKGTDCPSGSCVDHVCSLAPHRSDSSKLCLSDSECPSGTCSAGHCIKRQRASTKLPSGSFCSVDSQCSSGKCVLEKCAFTIPKLADGSL